LRIGDGGFHRGRYPGSGPRFVKVRGPFEARWTGRLHDLVLEAPVFHQGTRRLIEGYVQRYTRSRYGPRRASATERRVFSALQTYRHGMLHIKLIDDRNAGMGHARGHRLGRVLDHGNERARR